MHKKIPFKVLAVVLLGFTFVLGSVSGMFLYATGEEVLEGTRMQMVSHTEYRFDETGQIIARLVNYQGNAVAVDSCEANILYPNKTFFVSAGAMSASAIQGDHYYSFQTPSAGPEGVYEYQATCFYTVGAQTRNASVTNSFHLSGAFNQIFESLSVVETNLDSINVTVSSLIGLNDTVLEMNQTLTDLVLDVAVLSSAINEINSTTANTYQYLTGTLTSMVDNVLIELGVINATVNRIELNTEAINTTVNQILQNQEDQVIMTVFSG